MDEHKCDHSGLWTVVTVILILLLIISFGVGRDVTRLNNRVGMLEKHCALDAEVKDMDRRVKVLEEVRRERK